MIFATVFAVGMVFAMLFAGGWIVTLATTRPIRLWDDVGDE